MAKTQSIFGQELRDSIPRDYILIPRELYTKMVESAARLDMVEEQIPEEWCMNLLDVFNKGMDTIAYEKKQEAELAERKAMEEKKAAEEREKAKHRCPDPGKLKSLMGAGWTAEDLSCEFGVSVAEIYTWMSELLRGKYDGALTIANIANMEVR